MLRLKPYNRRIPQAMWCWPGDGTGTPEAVADVFGPRVFASPPHASPYDFHVGIDRDLTAGANVYAVMSGVVQRINYTMFGWESAAQLSQFTKTGSDATFTRSAPTSLQITGSRTGAKSFPTTTTNYLDMNYYVDVSSADWEIRKAFTSNPSLTGAVQGFALVDLTNNQYMALETDGTTITVRGVQAAGTMSVDGTTAVASPIWLSITYTQSTDTVTWRYSNDQATWTNIATKTPVAFSHEGYPAFVFGEYWKSLDTAAGTQSVLVDVTELADTALGRFGNFVQIQNGAQKTLQMHNQEPLVVQGQMVEAGQLIALAGNTGFDAASGPVNTTHCHWEYVPNANFAYLRAESTNPLAIGIMPRTNVTNNVAVVVSSALDPYDGTTACVRLRVAVTRADQNFDFNAITVTGTTTSVTVNFNTRAGLNANPDNPTQGGVSIVPEAFDENSATNFVNFYVSRAVIGSYQSYSATDTSGNVVASATTVALDGPALAIYVPQTAADFTTLSLTAPNNLYRMQETSLTLADSIGALTLAKNGTPTYAQTVASWGRKGIGFGASGANYFNNTGIVDPATTSIAVLGYITVTAKPATTTRLVMSIGTTTLEFVSVNQTPVLQINTTVTTPGTLDPTTFGVMPYLMLYNRSTSAAKLYTLNEKLSATYNGSLAGAELRVGNNSTVVVPSNWVAAYMWSGATCQTAFPSDAAVKSYLQALNWAISWT